MDETPVTIPGWEAQGYRFTNHDSDGAWGFHVQGPGGEDLGSVIDDTPESASAKACQLADADQRKG